MGASGSASESKLTKMKLFHNSTLNSRETAGCPVEVGLVHLGRVDQLARRVVGPVVERAAKQAPLEVAGAFDKHVPTVPAHVGHHPDLTGLVLGDQQRVVIDRDSEIVARIGDEIRAADAQPGPVEDRLLLVGEPVLGGVELGREEPRVRHVAGRLFERVHQLISDELTEPQLIEGAHRQSPSQLQTGPSPPARSAPESQAPRVCGENRVFSPLAPPYPTVA